MWGSIAVRIIQQSLSTYSAQLWFIFTFAYFELYKTEAFGGVAFEVLLHQLQSADLPVAIQVYGIDRMMYGSAPVWFLMFLVPVFALFRDYT